MILTSPVLLWIGLALTAAGTVGFVAHARRRRRLAEFLGGARAVRRLFRTALMRVRWARLGIVVGAGMALSAAAGGLQVADPPAPPEPPAVRVVLAIDVSASMQAGDVAPSRLGRATEVARGLLAELEDADVGLVLFAGMAYPLAPPTHDHGALRFFLEGLTPSIASATDPGTRLSAGIAAGTTWLTGSTNAQEADAGPEPVPEVRAIVLLTDGDASEPDPELAAVLQAARDEAIAVHAIGIGSSDGATMSMPAGRYQLGGPVLDATGSAARSRLREGPLRDLAGEGGGGYVSGGAENAETEIAGLITSARAEAVEATEVTPTEWWRSDLPLLLGGLALFLILLEGLLDLPTLWRGRRERAEGAHAGPVDRVAREGPR